MYLSEILATECPQLVGTGERTNLVLDTNFFNFDVIGAEEYDLIITSGVVDELWRHQNVIPSTYARELIRAPSTQIFDHNILREDKLIIKGAVKEYAARLLANGKSLGEGKTFRKNGLMGDVDDQQVSCLMEMARGGENVILISSDGDLSGTVEILKEQLDYMRDHAAVVSLRKYIERPYEKCLEGHKGLYRKELKKLIAEPYLIAA